MSKEEQDEILHASINRKDWTMSEWKESDNIIDRTVWFIHQLSPHNLWTGYKALKELEAETRKQVAEEIVARLAVEVMECELMKNKIEHTDGHIHGVKRAIYLINYELKKKELKPNE